MSKKRPGRRYRLESSYSSDSFMGGDTTWHVIDTRTGEQVVAFTGNRLDNTSIQSVQITKGEVIAMNGRGKVVDRVDLSQFRKK